MVKHSIIHTFAALRLGYGRLTSNHWLFVVLPLAVSMGLIVGVGGNLQYALFSMAFSDRPSIYSSAYENGIVQWPVYGEWVLESAWSALGAVGFLAVILSAYAQRLKSFSVRVATWTAALLTLVDFCTGLMGGALSIGGLARNVLANTLGGFAIGLISLIGLTLYHLLSAFIGSGNRGRVAAACGVLAFGMAINGAVYYILYFFYQPVPTEIDAVVGQPAKGAFIPDESRGSGFLPKQHVHGGWEVNSAGSAPRVHWNRAKDARRYDADIRLYADCSSSEIADLPPAVPTWKITNVHAVEVSADPETTSTQIAFSGEHAFGLRSVGPQLFWVDHEKAPKDPKTEVTLFLDGGDRIWADASDDIKVLYTVHLYHKHGEVLQTGPRDLLLSIDGKTWREHFSFVGQWLGTRKSKCVPALSQVPSSNRLSGAVALPENSTAVTLLLTLRSDQSDPSRYENEQRISLSRISGWSRIGGIPPEDWEEATFGSARGVAIEKGVTSLTVDGRKVEAKDSDTLTASGKLDIRGLPSGSLEIRGRADYLWLNEDRLSPTKWERLSGQWGAAILALLSAIVGSALTYLLANSKSRLHENFTQWPI